MLTRRLFLLASLGLSVCPYDIAPTLARSRSSPAIHLGLHSVSRLVWPPALVPDHIGLTDRSNLVVSDELGQVAILDLKHKDNTKIVGKVHGLGKRILDFSPAGQRAFAICLNDSPSGDNAYTLVSVSLVPACEPSIMSQMPLEHFAEPTCLTVSPELICIGGIANNGANLVAVYRRQRSQNPSLISTFAVQSPIQQLDLQDKSLVVLQVARGTQIDYVSLYYPHAPQLRKGINLDGDYRAMARFKESMLVAGQPSLQKQFEVRSIMLEPSPHAVAYAPLTNINRVLDAAAQKGRFFVLADSPKGQVIVTYTVDKTLDLTMEDNVALPVSKETPSLSCRLLVKDRNAYVAAGWAGIEVLSYGKTGWHHDFTFSIPRLSASSMAISDNLIVLASADLKAYNISKPDKPSLYATVYLKQPIKGLASVDNSFLCLTKNSLTWHKFDNPADIIATHDISGVSITYDVGLRKAFVLAKLEKKTVVFPISLVGNHLSAEGPLELPLAFSGIYALNGMLALRTLNEISLYSYDGALNLIGTRNFDNLAIRDVVLSNDFLAASAVDRNSRGFLLVLSIKDGNLKPLGVVNLTHDGAALAISGRRAAVVGHSTEGKDTLTLVDLQMPALPKVTASIPILESASAVSIKENQVIVAGRGLEILRL